MRKMLLAATALLGLALALPAAAQTVKSGQGDVGSQGTDATQGAGAGTKMTEGGQGDVGSQGTNAVQRPAITAGKQSGAGTTGSGTVGSQGTNATQQQ